jgi:hypothetical protein
MNEKTMLGLASLAAAIVLGVAGNLLLRVTPWGLNLFLASGLFVGALVLIVRKRQVVFSLAAWWMILPVLFFASAFVWRDSVTLNGLNIIALSCALGIMAWLGLSGGLRTKGCIDVFVGLLLGFVYMLAGLPMLVFQAIAWRSLPDFGWKRRAAEIALGVLIAVPLLVVFGGLFMAADAAFAGFVGMTFRFDLGEWFSQLGMVVLWTWVFAGLLYAILFPRGVEQRSIEAKPVLSALPLTIVLVLINALFLAFVMVQFRYFFGGAPLVEASVTLTYAEYARRGFAELVGVASLVLIMLLLLDWLAVKTTRREVYRFRILSGILVFFVFVILGSALQRMQMYQTEFGQTELRVYTTAFMLWLAVVFIWLAATVLRGQRQQFAWGAIVAAFVGAAVLNILNPDDYIVRANLARGASGYKVDVAYLASLSADAVPALVEGYSALKPEYQAAINKVYLHDKKYPYKAWVNGVASDWRSWNWSRTRAVELMNASPMGH